MPTVRSQDGTTIRYEAWGDGRPVVMVDGATAHRAVAPLPEQVAGVVGDRLRVVAYDRRGRGQSGDTPPYSTEREIEDLAAVIEAAGAPAMVCGFSSGAVLSLDATAAGLPISRLVVFEPPFVVDDGRPPLPADYVERLEASVAAGRPDDAAELFLTAAAGMPPEAVAGMRQSPYWAPVEEVAHTLSYDGRFMGTTMSGAPLPADRWAAIDVPVLVLHGRDTMPSIIAAAHALTELLPTAELRPVEGANHDVAAEVLGPVLTEFAGAE